jgi:high-affinity iron transporter
LRPSLILILILGFGSSPLSGSAADRLSSAELAPVRSALGAVQDALHSADLDAVEQRALEAYLIFEALEPSIAAFDPALLHEFESAYGEIRLRAAAGDATGAAAALDRVHDLLEQVEESPPIGPRLAFLQSFGILFREGIEALLLCTALAAACARRGAGRLRRAIAQGALAALVASVATAIVFERLIRLAPAGREAVEGMTMVLASAVLFYVSYWLLSKIEVARWMTFLRQQAGRAESRWALAGVAFLAVYREGFETILFYQALAGAGAPGPIALGFVAAAAVLAAIAVAVLRFGVRLPARPLFAVTGGLLYYLAVVFAGQGVHELQEAGWLGLTPVVGIPEIGWLGLYPSVQTLVAQGILVALALLAAIVLVRRARTSAQAVARPAALR